MSSGRSGAWNDSLLDCTSSCCLPLHAARSTSCIALGDVNLVKRLKRICGNPYKAADQYGRCSLHVAASLGHSDIVAWLVESQGVEVDGQDGESRWTPLHRSLYFGHLQTAVTLIKLGASLVSKDSDGWTPLDLVSSDLKEEFVGCKKYSMHTVSTWGNNANSSLGHEHSRMFPETLSMPVDKDVGQEQVVLCKFHSVFLSSNGRVFTCGLGRGGRLGHGTEHTLIEPTVISELLKEKIVQVAASRDHTVFLTRKGVVYTCGLNDAHQLGHGTNLATAPAQLLSPKPIKGLKGTVCGVSAGRFHTAVSTRQTIFTFGGDHGQLGYKAKYETQVSPRPVPGMELHTGEEITMLSASDAATACFTSDRRIFLCYDYNVRVIALADQFTEKDLHFTQFAVCATLGDYERKKKQILTSPVITALLDSSGDIWYWTLEHKVCRKVYLKGTKGVRVTQFILGKKLTVTTDLGKIFVCDTKVVCEDKTGQGLQPESMLSLPATRMEGIHNAQAVFTDFKGNNFALCRKFSCPAVDSFRDSSDYSSEILTLRHGEGTFPDCYLTVGDYSLPCHTFVLARRSNILRSLLEESVSGQEDSESPSVDVGKALGLKSLQPASLLLYVDYLYSVDTAFTVYVHRREHLQKSFSEDKPLEVSPQRGGLEAEEQDEPLYFTRSISHSGFMGFCDLISRTHIVEPTSIDRQTISKGRYIATLPKLPPFVYPGNSVSFTDFYLESSSKDWFPCHRSILIARSDFFRSMLTMGWKESYGQDGVSLPFTSRSVELVLEYLYSDRVLDMNKLATDSVLELLVVTDQLLLNGLRQICETELAQRVNLKEIAELAEFGHVYNAPHLFAYCLQFICFNLSFFLESNYLFGVSSEVLLKLNKMYQDTVPVTKRRIMRVTAPDATGFFADLLSEAPSKQESVESVDDHSLFGDVHLSLSPSSGKPQNTGRRRRKRKPSKTDTTPSSTGRHDTTPSPTSRPDTTPSPTSRRDSAEERSLKDISNKTQTVRLLMGQFPYEMPASEGTPGGECQQVQKEPSAHKGLDTGPSFEPVDDAGKSEVVEKNAVNTTSRKTPKKSAAMGRHWTQLPSLQVRSSFEQIQKEQLAKQPSQAQTESITPSRKLQLSSAVVAKGNIPQPAQVKPSLPWGKVSHSTPVTSLKEVMKEEVKKMTGFSPQTMPAVSETKSPTPTHPVGTVWGRPVGGQTTELDNRKYVSPPTSPVSMVTIMADERQRMNDPSRGFVKSMDCIEIEEKAIQKLEVLYSTKNNPDEWITVERDTKHVDTPVWVKEFT